LIGSSSTTFEVSLSLTTTLSTRGNYLNLIVTDLTDLLAANGSRDCAENDKGVQACAGQFLCVQPAAAGHRSDDPDLDARLRRRISETGQPL
jgi:hypothetical protein